MYNYAYQDDDAPTFYVNLSAANHMRNDLCNNVYVKPYKVQDVIYIGNRKCLPTSLIGNAQLCTINVDLTIKHILVLSNLLKKVQFEWPEEVENAFKPLKQAMTYILTLTMPNLNETSMIELDASGEGIGTVLTQQGKPIAFMSRILGVFKRLWSTYAKEMLAIVQAIRT